MKALTLTQPWASLVAIGVKRIETRSWSTSYRGPLLIHAAKGFPKDCRELCFEEPFFACLSGEYRRHEQELLPLGAIVAVCELQDCISTGLAVTRIRDDVRELAFGNFGPNRFAWFLSDARRLNEPIQCRGHLGLWVPPDDVLQQLPQRATPTRDEAVEDLAALPSGGSGDLSALGLADGAVALVLGSDASARGTADQDVHALRLPQDARQPSRTLSQSHYNPVNGASADG